MYQEKSDLFEKALNLEHLNLKEGLYLYKNLSLAELALLADKIRNTIHPDNYVSYIIDRNINLSNLCISNCLFCNFCRTKKSPDAYVLTFEEYENKINELLKLGGKQILLQGGIHPNLDLNFYLDLFSRLRNRFPELKLHALGPAEIVYISNISNLSINKVLDNLIDAGLDSLPGAGAEILSDRVRKIISPLKCNSMEWLDVMKIAHQKGLTTSATMMFGHLETIEERIEHLIKLRNVQQEKPKISKGFISFTLWPLAGNNTRLLHKYPKIKPVTRTEFIKMLALSRIMLPNIPNIQTSWLTMGADVAQVCLHSGANDMSSIMIEENVVSKAGKNYKMDVISMKKTIKNAGFMPMERNQEYDYILSKR